MASTAAELRRGQGYCVRTDVTDKAQVDAAVADATARPSVARRRSTPSGTTKRLEHKTDEDALHGVRPATWRRLR